MKRFVIVLTLLNGAGVTALHAGQWELSASGSYYKNDNGVIAGDASETTISRIGTSISYAFMQSTALEISYSDSKNTDVFSQVSSDETIKFRVNRETRIKNVSLDLVIGFAGQGSRFKPYLRGGGGYTIRKTTTGGTETDLTDDSGTPLDSQIVETKSVTAQAGTGFRYFLADRVALELSYTMFASELDQPEIYLHHAFSAGLRMVF